MHAIFIHVPFIIIKCRRGIWHESRGVSRCVLEPPLLPADLFVLSPGYKVLPDLATVPPPFSMHSLRSWSPQHWFKCSKWRCQHRDIKHVIFSCRNDVMNPYKRSRPDRDAVLWLPTANWTISRLSNRVLSWNHSRCPHCFPCQIKLLLSYYWVNSVGIMVQPAPWWVIGTTPTALAFSIRFVITVAPRSNWESKPVQGPQPCWCGEPSLPK